ncbi:MAG: hypothetical protein PHW96_00015 [Candidatus Nanoarchaeia archaeon]|nr:hypothetical protein [Candidatus Nanoarchaeia archaeon]
MKYTAYFKINGGFSNGLGMSYPRNYDETDNFFAKDDSDALTIAFKLADYYSTEYLGCGGVTKVHLQLFNGDGEMLKPRHLMNTGVEPIMADLKVEKGSFVFTKTTMVKFLESSLGENKEKPKLPEKEPESLHKKKIKHARLDDFL